MGTQPIVLDRLGIIHKEFFTKKGQLHSYLVTNKQYISLEDLIQLQKELGSEEIRVYMQKYSRFAEMPHTGVILCINSTNTSFIKNIQD